MSAHAVETRAEIIIVGTGFAGLGMPIRLKERGHADFVMLERARDLGGMWRDNTYPGCACDIPSELYSFSFEPNAAWSRVYPTRAEIHAYLRRCAERHDLAAHIRFEREVTEARFDDATARWTIATRAGETFLAPVLVLGMGGLSTPAYPQIAGMADFGGSSFHSARWDPALDLRGQRVAVIGTGASAVQFVPQIAPQVARLSIFQRTPPWVLPKRDGLVSERKRCLLRRVPGYAAASRAAIYWSHEVNALGFTCVPELLRLGERIARRHVADAIADPALRAKVTPAYRLGCKRVLFSNDYYPALTRPNVDVVTSEIERIDARGIVTTAGRRHDVDVIVYGTGFRAQDGVSPVKIFGSGGASLDDAWRSGSGAYLGTSVAGFPNLFILIGPNTGTGHGSMVYMIESQINYVLDALRALRRRRATAFDVRPEIQAAFNARLDRKSSKTVWQTGCRSWYLDRRGKNTTLWPGFTFEFRAATKHIDPKRYRWFTKLPDAS